MTRPLPPGPPGRRFFGHLGQFRGDRLDFFTRCARDYGDLVPVRLAHRQVLLASGPDLIEEVLLTKSKHFIKHFALRLNPQVLGNGLLTSEGDFWLKQRRLVQPAFSKPRLARYAEVMLDCVERLVADWQQDQERNVEVEMMRLTLDIATRTLFSSDARQDAQVVSRALQTLQENFLQRFNTMFLLPGWFPTPGNIRSWRAVARLDEIVYRFIRERRQSPGDQGDLLSILLHAQDEDDGSRMSDKQVRDEAMTLFLAGHETTALSLSWTWYLLSQHPEAEAKVVAEVREVCGERKPTFDDVSKLGYIEKVLLESMRLYPPAYVVGREATDDVHLGGYDVPKGMTVMMSQWVVHRDPRFYEAPAEFRPERWEPERMQRLPKFAYFPFGGGPRLCIGNTFAMIEMVLVIASLAQRFRFTLKPGSQVGVWPTFTLRPQPGIPAVVATRPPA